MKTKLLSVAALLLVVVMCFSACGGGNSTVSFTEEEGVVGGELADGTYTYVGVYNSEGKESKAGTAILNKLKEQGSNIDLIVEGEKVKMMESDYTLKDGKLVGEDGVLSYAIKDGRITIIDDNDPTSKTVFEMK